MQQFFAFYENAHHKGAFKGMPCPSWILRNASMFYQKIANTLGVSYCGVHSIVKRHLQLGFFISRKRLGRPRATTPQDDRAIARVVKRLPKASSLQVLIRLPDEARNISTWYLCWYCELHLAIKSELEGWLRKHLAFKTSSQPLHKLGDSSIVLRCSCTRPS